MANEKRPGRRRAEQLALVMSRLDDGSVAMATSLDAIAVDAGRARRCEPALARLFPAIIVDIFEVEGM